MELSSNTLTTTSLKLRTLNEIPLFASIIIVAEFLALSLPNVSLTPLLFAVYFSARGYKQSLYLITVYMIVEILQWGFGLWNLPMFLGWTLWMVMVKEIKLPIPFLGFTFGYLYGIMFMPLTVIVYNVDWWAYLVADFPYATTMAVSNTITLMFLHKVLTKFLTERS